MESPDQLPSAEQQSTNQNDSTEPIRTEDILLERLKHAPPIKPQVPPPMLIGIIFITLALGVIVFLSTRKSDTFAEDPHAAERQQATSDSTEQLAKRMKLQPVVDSLGVYASAHPDDPEAHKQYANALYEVSEWPKAQAEYEAYLKSDPKDPNAIVDYAYVLTQTTEDYKLAIETIKKALAIDPEHVKALFNAGLLSLQAYPDKAEAMKESQGYFNRARAAAAKKGETQMVATIDQVLSYLEKMKTQGESSDSSSAPPPSMGE